MFVVKLEYGLGADSDTESCVVFDDMAEARRFAHDAIDEICDKVGGDDKTDNAIIRVWDCESDNELINDLHFGEN